MRSQASSRRNQRRFSTESQESTDSIVEQPGLPTQQAPQTDCPTTPAEAHLSHTHDDRIQPIQDRYEADQLVGYYKWQINHDDDDKGDSRGRSRSTAAHWQDQEAIWSMAATRRRELEKRSRRTNKLWIGCAATLVVVIIVVVVVFVVLGNQGMLSS
ncbi:hypothetical protein MCOR27_003216 [Pyricularia oryzae]|uniref:Uncharacterized protein n=1 Tax=Pyricularia grisea TaxID=148305 RepID=A0ABQ8NQN2_PYRGI|nr:hypothetical protein MCOR01_004803 [Pyricularia oryzae]KAI6300581.1 hypothetical protein MCOR33_003739 [Pyricularia grisea]KAH9431546.1 hypothetical protein MCOR02_008836 [Pyricularia oryzae]KAI6251787.1 hypothetical protein MCOR19_011584 [Pyricularia oryzae]KAI6283474.1 hypothetical protein MCOR27_003216 [Pyricularia oryzae]